MQTTATLPPVLSELFAFMKKVCYFIDMKLREVKSW